VTFAAVSRAFREVAASAMLPQASRGVIRCQARRSQPGRVNHAIRDMPDLLETLEDWQTRGVFAPPRTALVLTEHGGMRNVPEGNLTKAKVMLSGRGSSWAPLPTVTSLDLSVPPTEPKTKRQLPASLVKVLVKRLPQLRTLRLDHVASSIPAAVETAVKVCQHLTTLSWHGPPPNIFFLSGQTLSAATALKHVRLDHAEFYNPDELDFRNDGTIITHGLTGRAMYPDGVPPHLGCPFVRMRHLHLETLSLVSASVRGAPLRPSAYLVLVKHLWPDTLRGLRIDASIISGPIGQRITAERPGLALVLPDGELL